MYLTKILSSLLTLYQNKTKVLQKT